MASSAPFDLREEQRKLRQDFVQLGRVLATERAGAKELLSIAQKTIEHSRKFDLIAVFRGEIDEFEVGRVLMFQDYVRANVGIAPRVVKTMAHCIKVFFDLGDSWRDRRDTLIEFFSSAEFADVCQGLDLSYVQFAGQLFPPQPSRR